jgi:DNA-binding MarR family transcriptional regulator
MATVKAKRLSSAEKHALALRNWPDLAKKGCGIAGKLWRAADHVRDVVTPKIVRHGIQLGDFEVLFILRIFGPPYALSPTQIYRVRCCSSGGLTKILHRLKKSHLIERYPNPKDKRSELVRLTPKGKRVVEAAMDSVARLETNLLARFDRREKDMLTTLLDKLLTAI